MTRTDLVVVARGIAPILREFATTIGLRIAALETKERGLDGQKGDTGPAGPEGLPGRDGRDGQPGIPGATGFDGKDGKDGLGFDDLQVLHDGERTVTLRFASGERVKDFTVTFPVVIYRGVFTEGRAYARGDMVTWGGSTWHAKETTTAKPGETAAASRAWQLAVKVGRDGKDGKEGKPGPQGLSGTDGRDLR